MGTQSGNITYNTFIKGIITESTDINFPAGASYDEANLVLSKKASRRRRLGIDYLNAYMSPTGFTLPDISTGGQYKYYWWKGVAATGSINFLVIQIGPKLYFYNKTDLSYIGIFDLTTVQIPSAVNVGNDKVSMVSNRGNLFVVGKQLQPFYLTWNGVGFFTTTISLSVRDFDGLNDGLAVDNNPATLSDTHQYNLKNQGWTVQPGGADPITTYFVGGTYPSNTQVWYVGKNGSGVFSAATLNQTDFGTTPAPKGRYILDPFNKNRGAVSGIGTLPTETYASRPQCVEAFSGRIWYAGLEENAINGNVYYSQVLDNRLSNVGNCYQQADPTSENDAALVDTDGGVIPIAKAGRILSLFSTNDTVIVFADNGIWSIAGTSGGGFKATDFETYQISNTALISRDSIIEVDGKIIYWTDRGISFLSRDSISGKFVEESLSDDTFKTFYDAIPAGSRATVQAIHDVQRKQIQWLYSNIPGDSTYKRTTILIFDLSLSAYTYFTISPLLSNSPYILGAVDFQNTTNWWTSSVTYLTIVPSGALWNFNFSTLSNPNFLDWKTANGVGVDCPARLESGFEYAQDIQKDKQLPYLFAYFDKTETAFVLNPITGGYDFDKPSSCFLSVKWDFTDSSSSNKWSRSTQAYKFKQLTLPNPLDLTFTPGYKTIVSKNKVRGRGKALRYRFDSEVSKDFILLGWASNMTGNTEV